MAEFDAREFERRLSKLEEQMTQVLTAVRQREDDLGSIRAGAGKVPQLLEEFRALRQEMRAGARDTSPAAATVVTPPAAPVQQSAPIDTKAVVRSVFEQLLSKGTLPTLDDLKRIVREEIGTQLKALVNVEQLQERIWKEITATGVEERLAKLLKDRVGNEVDVKTVIRGIVDEIITRLNVEKMLPEITAGVVEKLAGNLELRRRSGY